MYALASRGDLAECQFSNRETLAFRFMVHRTRLFGLYLADAMGLSDEEALSYSNRLAEIYVETGDDNDVVDQALCDLHDIGICEYRQTLENQLRTAEGRAEEQFYC